MVKNVFSSAPAKLATLPFFPSLQKYLRIFCERLPKHTHITLFYALDRHRIYALFLIDVDVRVAIYHREIKICVNWPTFRKEYSKGNCTYTKLLRQEHCHRNKCLANKISNRTVESGRSEILNRLTRLSTIKVF